MGKGIDKVGHVFHADDGLLEHKDPWFLQQELNGHKQEENQIYGFTGGGASTNSTIRGDLLENKDKGGKYEAWYREQECGIEEGKSCLPGV